jgi:chemotaxis-related protein WspB
MLLITFRYDDQTYALNSRNVREVMPYVRLREWHTDERGVRGLLNWRGEALPVIDAGLLLCGRPSQARLSTRIAVLELEGYQAALLMEQATETLHVDEKAIKSDTILHEAIPCLGQVLLDDDEIIQLIDTKRLLRERMKKMQP